MRNAGYGRRAVVKVSTDAAAAVKPGVTSEISQPVPSPFKIALVMTLFLRVLYSSIGLLASRTTAPAELIRTNAFTDNLTPRSSGFFAYTLVGMWERFDALWYTHIAGHGYDLPAAVVFYPLYPALIRALTPVVRSPILAAVIIATVATFFLLWGFLKLVSLDYGSDTARRAALIYMVLPASFVFLAGYAESLVVALIIWSIYLARTQRWFAAACLGILAALTKAVGILVIVPLLVLALRNRRARVPLAFLPAAGSAAFMLWLHYTGHILPSAAYEKYWNIHVAPPWTTFVHYVRYCFTSSNPALWFQLAFLVLLAITALSPKLRLEYRAFALAALCLLLAKDGTPEQNPWARYVLILFPGVITLALSLTNRFRFRMCMSVFFALNLAFLWLFFGWSFVA
jgi:Gpi18-like mannosyltransferase